MCLESSIEADIDSLTILGAHNKGGGGNGYGVELHEAFDNTLRNLVVEDMRHAVIFSAWHAEARNERACQTSPTATSIFMARSISTTRSLVDELTLAYAADRSSVESAATSGKRFQPAGGTNHAATDFLAVNTVSP